MMSTEEYMSTIPHTDMVSTCKREWIEGIVVDSVALGPIRTRTDELHDIVRCV